MGDTFQVRLRWMRGTKLEFQRMKREGHLNLMTRGERKRRRQSEIERWKRTEMETERERERVEERGAEKEMVQT